MVRFQPMGDWFVEQRQVHSFSFSGTGMEYFWICLRTFLLAIITLGIYDAWGTVERRRYIYGHTRVAGNGFDYHAKPKTILIGRLIAIAIIITFQVVSTLTPEAAIVVTVGFLLALPWIINRSLRFQLRNTSYRNVRFNFFGSYWTAFGAYLLMPFSLGFSLGLTYPLVARAAKEYVVNNASFGSYKFSVRIPLKPLYLSFIFLALAVIIFAVAFFAAIFLLDFGLGETVFFPGGGVARFVVMMLMVYLSYLIFQIILRNSLFRHMALEGGHRFNSYIPILGYIWVIVSGSFLATITLGLLLPWATVRIHRYQMVHTELLLDGDMDQFTAQESEAGDAVGAELGGMEGVTDGLLSGI